MDLYYFIGLYQHSAKLILIENKISCGCLFLRANLVDSFYVAQDQTDITQAYQERNLLIMSLSSIQIIAADPAGNKTIFVLTPVSREFYQPIASYLLSLKEHNAEQIAFVLPDEPGLHGRMEMCGLEFCGNASRTFALIQAKKLGFSGQHTLRVRVSGCEDPLDVEVNVETNYTKIRMPVPLSITSWNNDVLVDLGGILHLVTMDKAPNPAAFETLKEQLIQEYDPPALGVMFFQPENCSLTPVVYVADVRTTYFEGSCASGTVAVIAALTHACPSGDYSYTIQQPQGELTASIKKGKNHIDSVFIEGPVAAEEPITIQLPLQLACTGRI
jgi:diaminopimelate epimerase